MISEKLHHLNCMVEVVLKKNEFSTQQQILDISYFFGKFSKYPTISKRNFKDLMCICSSVFTILSKYSKAENTADAFDIQRYWISKFLFVVERCNLYQFNVAKFVLKVAHYHASSDSNIAFVKDILRLFLEVFEKVSETNRIKIIHSSIKWVTLRDLMLKTSDIEMQFIVVEIILKLFVNCSAEVLLKLLPEVQEIPNYDGCIKKDLYSLIRKVTGIVNEKNSNFLTINAQVQINNFKLKDFDTTSEMCLDVNLKDSKLSFFYDISILQQIGKTKFLPFSWETLSIATCDVTNIELKKLKESNNYQISMEIPQTLLNITLNETKNILSLVINKSEDFLKFCLLFPKLSTEHLFNSNLTDINDVAPTSIDNAENIDLQSEFNGASFALKTSISRCVYNPSDGGSCEKNFVTNLDESLQLIDEINNDSLSDTLQNTTHLTTKTSNSGYALRRKLLHSPNSVIANESIMKTSNQREMNKSISRCGSVYSFVDNILESKLSDITEEFEQNVDIPQKDSTNVLSKRKNTVSLNDNVLVAYKTSNSVCNPNGLSVTETDALTNVQSLLESNEVDSSCLRVNETNFVTQYDVEAIRRKKKKKKTSSSTKNNSFEKVDVEIAKNSNTNKRKMISQTDALTKVQSWLESSEVNSTCLEVNKENFVTEYDFEALRKMKKNNKASCTILVKADVEIAKNSNAIKNMEEYDAIAETSINLLEKDKSYNVRGNATLVSNTSSICNDNSDKIEVNASETTFPVENTSIIVEHNNTKNIIEKIQTDTMINNKDIFNKDKIERRSTNYDTKNHNTSSSVKSNEEKIRRPKKGFKIAENLDAIIREEEIDAIAETCLNVAKKDKYSNVRSNAIFVSNTSPVCNDNTNKIEVITSETTFPLKNTSIILEGNNTKMMVKEVGTDTLVTNKNNLTSYGTKNDDRIYSVNRDEEKIERTKVSEDEDSEDQYKSKLKIQRNLLIKDFDLAYNPDKVRCPQSEAINPSHSCNFLSTDCDSAHKPKSIATKDKFLKILKRGTRGKKRKSDFDDNSSLRDVVKKQKLSKIGKLWNTQRYEMTLNMILKNANKECIQLDNLLSKPKINIIQNLQLKPPDGDRKEDDLKSAVCKVFDVANCLMKSASPTVIENIKQTNEAIRLIQYLM